MLISAYDKLTFQEAAAIIYYVFCNSKVIYMAMMEDLIVSKDSFYRHIAPAWYDSFKQNLQDNKKIK
jgi:hypothetical protein